MHYYQEILSGNGEQWHLVRETRDSSKWHVLTEDKRKLAIDIHFTPEKVLTVNIVVEGSASKSFLNPIMDKIARLGLIRGMDYAVIDFTLSEVESITYGNYSIDARFRRSFML